MKSIKLKLFHKVLIGIALGVALGFVLPDYGVRLLKTFNILFSQLLKFIVPLLVLGLVTPAIANLGKGAGKMLLAVVLISYLSTVCAGFFAFGWASSILPHILQIGELSTDSAACKSFAPFIDLKIPPLCDIMTALVIAFMIGIGLIAIKGDTLKKWFDEFGEIVKITIEKVIIPLLPVYIFTMIAELAASGKIGMVLGTGIKIILCGIIASVVFLLLQFIIAGLIAKKNPFKCLWNMAPAYLTGFSISSSSACIPVTHECSLKNGVNQDIADFTIPLCSTMHMCGSTIKLAVTSIAIAYIFGMNLSFGLVVQFVLVQAVAAVAAPGVMGGVLMASVGLLDSIYGFSPEMTALMMTIYLAVDGYGPACNVTGDGAIALVIDHFFGKK